MNETIPWIILLVLLFLLIVMVSRIHISIELEEARQANNKLNEDDKKFKGKTK